MNKKEFYEAAVSLYKKTGQGVPSFVATRIDQTILKELIDEGLLKIVETKYSYLPNDEWICLTNVYCPEEDNGDMRGLTFMRAYLGIDDLGLGVKLSDALHNETFLKGYGEWLKKNEEQLGKIKNL